MKHLPQQGPCDEPFERLRLCKICRFSEAAEGTRHCSRLVAHSPAMRQLLARVAVVAGTDSVGVDPR
ncbi:MAG: hypothetical protein QM756_25600 [Polyangiaceae bacterium]